MHARMSADFPALKSEITTTNPFDSKFYLDFPPFPWLINVSTKSRVLVRRSPFKTNMKIISLISLALAQLLTVQQDTKVMQLETHMESKWTTFNDVSLPDHQLRINADCKLCDPGVRQIVGYIDNLKTDSHLFFWFFESRNEPETDPVVLWLNGGPGCSSFTGLLMELGPCRVNPDSKGTTLHPHSWNTNASTLFLDQPVGTGFSYGSTKISTSAEGALEVYSFLRLFMHSFTKYRDLDFHVTGESYAGHYIPEIARVINTNNIKIVEKGLPKEDLINLKSILIGNGITDTLTQYKYYANMAEDTKYGPILTKKQIKAMKRSYPACKYLLKKCYAWQSAFVCVPAMKLCNKSQLEAYEATGLSPYDVRNNGSVFDMMGDHLEKWLNTPAIQEQLGVERKHVGCSDKTGKRYDKTADEGLPVFRSLPDLLHSGVRIMIYNGDADWTCNWIGSKAWVLKLNWNGKKGFNEAVDKFWISEATGKQAGEYRNFGNLSFLRVYKSSHFVPLDQPEHSLELINHMIHGIPLV